MRDRVVAGRAVVEHDEIGRVEFDTVLAESVERLQHARDGRDPLVVDALLEDVERPGVGQPDRPVAQPFLGDAEVDLGVRGGERHADVADAGAGSHAGDVGDGEDLCRGAVETGAGRPDPDPDRHGCVGDHLEQVLDLVVGDDGALAVDLEDERLRTGRRGVLDRGLDRVEQDRVEQAADLQDVDAGHVDGAVDRVACRVVWPARSIRCRNRSPARTRLSRSW